MKISVLQYDIAWCDAARNMATVEELVNGSQADVDMFVLPEMWSSGFVIEAQEVAETEESCAALRFMERVAAKRGCAVVGSLVIRESDIFVNRMFFITPESIAARYDKRHLFGPGGETKRFTAGTERVTVEWRGVRFLLQICYDLRFPVFARNRGDYDAAIYIASWPTARQRAWQVLAQARAIENQSFVIAANRTSTDPYCKYSGGSAIVDARGEIVAQAADAPCVLTAEIDIEELRAFRRKFPTLRDGDCFTLHNI